jgi:SAM-dependent methyltransferase
MDVKHWDDRYSEREYAYGTEPNDFLASVADRIPPGPVLTLGEGEGRNALFLAGLGYEVVAVDQSEVGLARTRLRATERGVRVQTQHADLRDYPIRPGARGYHFHFLSPSAVDPCASSRGRCPRSAARRGLHPGGLHSPAVRSGDGRSGFPRTDGFTR